MHLRALVGMSVLVVAGVGVASNAATATTRAMTTVPAPAASVSPSPGAHYAETHTEISFQGLPARELKDIVVKGSISGKHSGRILAFGNGKGGAFVPAKPFTAGETVQVAAPFQIIGGRGRTFRFTVGKSAPQPLVPLPTSPINAQVQSFTSAPDLHPAAHTITVNAGEIPGDVFLTLNGPAGLNGLQIDDSIGNLVYYKPTSDYVDDLRVQTWHGKPVITWWEGNVYGPGYGRGSYYIANTSYQVIKHFSAGNGLFGDAHEFTLTPQGTALITAYPAVQADDSASAGGSKQGDVLDGVVQEIDLTTNAVMFEWHALDHVSIADTYATITPPSPVLDPIHINSIQPYGNNQLIVSLRDMHQLLTLSRTTGVVDLRIGGARPNVHEPANAFTQSQHDAEPHSDGTISVFDNGSGVGAVQHPTSRGLILKVSGRSVSVVKELAAPSGELAPNQGSVQELGGGYLVDYASAGSVVLYDSDGNVINDTHYQRGVQSYRAFKTVWHATPHSSPTLAATTTSSGTTMAVSWNGATEVSSWSILSGPDAAHLTVQASAAKTGFETTIPMSITSGVVEAQAMSASGKVLGSTTPVTLG